MSLLFSSSKRSELNRFDCFVRCPNPLTYSGWLFPFSGAISKRDALLLCLLSSVRPSVVCSPFSQLVARNRCAEVKEDGSFPFSAPPLHIAMRCACVFCPRSVVSSPFLRPLARQNTRSAAAVCCCKSGMRACVYRYFRASARRAANGLTDNGDPYTHTHKPRRRRPSAGGGPI